MISIAALLLVVVVAVSAQQTAVPACWNTSITYTWSDSSSTTSYLTFFLNGTLSSYNPDGPYNQVGWWSWSDGAFIMAFFPDGSSFPVTTTAHDAYTGTVVNGTVSGQMEANPTKSDTPCETGTWSIADNILQSTCGTSCTSNKKIVLKKNPIMKNGKRLRAL